MTLPATETLLQTLEARTEEVLVKGEALRNKIIGETMIEVDEDLQLSQVLINHCIPKTQMAELCGWQSVNTFIKNEEKWIAEGSVEETIKIKGKWAYSPYHIHRILDLLGKPKWSDHERGTHIINVQNQKGGTGKSSLLINIAQALGLNHEQRFRILVIDLDPQGSLRTFTKPREYEQDDLDVMTAVDVMLGDLEPDSVYQTFKNYGYSHQEIIQEAILETELPNVQVITAFPEDERFSSIAWEDGNTAGMVKLLKERIIDPVKKDYDLIFIDSGPQVNPLTWSALYAANGVLCPVTPQTLDWSSTTQFIDKIPNMIRQLPEGAEGIRWFKIGITNHDGRLQRDTQMANRIKDEYGSFVFNQYVDKYHAFEIAARNHRTVMDISDTEKLAPKAQIEGAQACVSKFANLLLNHLKDINLKEV